ncbi:MAG: hypothetical protein GEV03_20560 [Streptosporangiales bacterium]|nr:hypothetical protein [Streptosporangiales bacterium]
MIGEFGTQEGAEGQRAAWLRSVAALAKSEPQIKALVYFDAYINRDGRVRAWSLRGSPPDLKAFRELAAGEYFNPRGLRVGKP